MSAFHLHILPALESLGIWAYWITGAAAFLEGWWVTGLVTPGTLVVDAGGALVRLGNLGFLDLAWFVGIGALLGGEASFLSGRWLGARTGLKDSAAFRRASGLVDRYGPLALIAGRFLGPVASLAPLAAALSGMERRRFSLWNAASAAIYALAHVGFGYLAGDILARVAPYLPRAAMPLAILALATLLVWLAVRQVAKGGPALHAAMSNAGAKIAAWPPLRRQAERHPRTAAFLSRRLAPGSPGGLLATAAAVLVIYLAAVFVDGALDLAFVPGTAELDQRISSLMHAYWTPGGLRLAAWATQLGHVPVAALVAAGSVAGFALAGRRSAAAGLAIAVAGNAVTVTLLKLAFGRARPELAYFLETSNSFPSGHAAISVALYGSLALLLWREKLIGPTLAIVSGACMAAMLGSTRIYLSEHYLSDVLNGWIVGTIWMVIGLAAAEAMRPRTTPKPLPAWRHVASIAALLACLGGAGWFAVHDVPAPLERNAAAAAAIADLPAALGSGSFELAVDRLDGKQLPPVSLVTEGLPADAIAARLAPLGWSPAPAPGLRPVLLAIGAELAGRAIAGAAEPPAFRDGQPADATLRSGDSVLRLWNAGTLSGGTPLAAWAFAPTEGSGSSWKPAKAEADAAQLLTPAPAAARQDSPAGPVAIRQIR
ncbi:bifunctional DedA family/phosphatase PAP2 family protein [Mangrovicoccus sp. HB161399]|uniref:bifunctional DedA family/phosphatase PAP2 family protein n=1 Tax=Mangrovicoccus sp. HB161399 TaxID=2720392 RepID=UPI001551F235|nr:phosphatase PAP2 family protein [Mangrovicoccus sp. HB161399]